ncbi:MAG: hypothetical protein ACLRSW_17525, partial [Christensenellaceae bacterium]
LQTCGFYQPSETGYSWTCHMSDEDDLRFQAYVSMAFGIRNFTHFTYKTSELYGQGLGYTQACVNKDGTINDLYYDAQAVNRELLSLDHVYLSLRLCRDEMFCRDGTNRAKIRRSTG